jgi:hypothetical protein
MVNGRRVANIPNAVVIALDSHADRHRDRPIANLRWSNVPRTPVLIARANWSRFVNNDNAVAVAVTAGVLIRRRSRRDSTTRPPYEAPATNIDNDVHVDVRGASSEALDHTLRAFARLLARQVARDLFEHECARAVNAEDLP